MDAFLYVFGNVLATLAGLLVLKVYLQQLVFTNSESTQKPTYKKLLVAPDLELMLFFSALARAYWSFSPPPVWERDPLVLRVIASTDCVFSIFLWGFITVFGLFYRQQIKQKVKACVDNNSFDGSPYPIWCKSYVLLGIATVFALVGLHFVEDEETGWYGADFMVMFNMAVDTLAMIPQMWIINNAEAEASSETCHFVGLLGTARMLRMLFWATTVMQTLMYDSYTGIWPFVIPDIIHTAIMGEYIWLWSKKIQRDSMELLGGGLIMLV